MKQRTRLLLPLILSLAACGGPSASDIPEYPPFEPLAESAGDEGAESTPSREPPPESAPPRDVRFPEVGHLRTANGLAIDVVPRDDLPVTHLLFVVRSGSDADPAALPGLSAFVTQMLKEGTASRTSSELASAFDEIGARLSVYSDQESIYLSVAVLSDELDRALGLVAEMVTQPAFDATELEKLRRRERDRLTMESQDPNWLGRRALRRELYGDHPYGHVDATLQSVDRFSKADLLAFHRSHFVAGNCFLVVAGHVNPTSLTQSAGRAFRRLRRGDAPTIRFPELAPRTGRQVVVVDRPGSVQSSIRVANLAIRRNSPDYVPLSVANHVLGGGANSRLFVDLREHRGLTYGAYSGIVELTEIAPFAVSTSVRTPVTVEATRGIFEHLARITSEAVPDDELQFAERYLADSFPLQIDTSAKVAQLVAQQRIFGLPEGYWDHYRSAIAEVTSEQALEAAQRDIRPAEAVVVIVGESRAFADDLAEFGPVRVVDVEGRTLREIPARAAE